MIRKDGLNKVVMVGSLLCSSYETAYGFLTMWSKDYKFDTSFSEFKAELEHKDAMFVFLDTPVEVFVKLETIF